LAGSFRSTQRAPDLPDPPRDLALFELAGTAVAALPVVLLSVGPAPLHPDPRVVQRVLDDPVLRPVLPVEFSDPAARLPVIVTRAPWLTLLATAGSLLRKQGR
jgi:hypothetical protein